MPKGFQAALLKTLGAQNYLLTVVETRNVTATFRRITFTTPTLFDDYEHSPTGWLRLWIPDRENPEKSHQRGYTIIEAVPDQGRFSIDFALHEPAGPASAWAMHAEAGQQLTATLYGARPFEIKETVAGYLLVGDASSLPAINSIIAAAGDYLPLQLYLALYHDEDREIPITPHPRLQVTYVDVAAHPDPDTALADAIVPREWSNWGAWVASEVKATRAVRESLKTVHGFPPDEVKAQGYWTKAKARSQKNEATAHDAALHAPPPLAPSPVAAAAVSVAPLITNDAAQEATLPSDTPLKPKWHSQAGRRLLAPLKNTLIVAGIVQAFITLLGIAPFLLITELARRVLMGAPAAELWQLGIWALSILGVSTFLSTLLIVGMHVVEARFATDLKQSLLLKLARLPLGWFTERGSGSVKHLVQDDTGSLHYLVTHAVLDVVAAVVSPLTVLIYLFIVDARLAAILLIPIIAYLVVFISMIQASTKQMPQATKWAQEMNSQAGQFLAGMPVIRVFGGSVASLFSRKLEGYLQFFVEWQRPFIQKKIQAELLSKPTTFLWIIVAVGTLFITMGWMPAVNLLPFLLLGTTFGPKLLGIAYGAGSLREGQAAAQRLGATLEETELQQLAPASPPRHVPPVQGVEFRHVTFGYHPNQPILHDVSLTLRPGTVTALVGPSGGGKSTLASLLARFYDVTHGQILVDGRDIRTLSAEELYQRVGFVFQSVQVVVGTVRENIALAKPDAPQSEVERVARLANIHEEILALPKGYETVLGEETKLSGGQQQRLTIARALLANPAVLVLDEATAFIDPESEYLVQQALSHLIEGRTVLMIAHRLHTVMSAEQLVVIEQGRIVQQGTHRDLVAADGLYQQLWKGA